MNRMILITEGGLAPLSPKGGLHLRKLHRIRSGMKVSLPVLPAPHIIDGSRRGGGNGDSGAGVRK